MRYLGTTSFSNHGVDCAEGNVVALVAYLADAHGRPSDGRYLEDRAQIPVDASVTQVEGLLAKILDCPSVTHQKLLGSPATG